MKSNQDNNSFRFSTSNPPEILDPVVEEALVRKLVNSKQVAEAWLKRRTMYGMGKQHPVWRWLANQDDVDGEALRVVAAKCYDYKCLDVTVDHLKGFVQRIIPCFTDDQWKVMVRVGLIPVKRTSQRGISTLWNFAANDPTAKAVHNIARQCVGRHYELIQADRKSIASLFAEVYLSKMELPRSTNPGADKKF
ncbi:MAG: hypothetical protein AB8G77_27090 [Rhodothermales bacterium]